MSKILIFSDIHLHEWPYGSRVINGYNNRLIATAKAVEDMFRYAKRLDNLAGVVFCGDLFHTHGTTTAAVIQTAHRLFWDANRKGIELAFLVGNHDTADRTGMIHCMGWLSSFGPVITEPQEFTLGGHKFIGCGYTEDVVKLQRVLDMANDQVVFLHQGVSGVPMGSGRVLNEFLSADMIGNNVRHCFTGHYHKHNRVSDKLTIVGSLTQQSWADEGQTHGFLEYDLNTGHMIQHESVAPKFHTFKFGEILDKQIKGNFIRLKNWDKDKTDVTFGKAQMRRWLADRGALSVEFIMDKEESEKTKSNYPGQFAITPVLERYIKKNKVKGRRKKIGEELRENKYETP